MKSTLTLLLQFTVTEGKDKNVELVLTEAKKFYNTKEITNAAGDIVVDAKYAIQDLGVAYGDKVPAKES